MDRLFGTLELRSTDDELREFDGIANTSALDDHGTVIEPAGARFTLPIPLLWQHDQKTPVGEITHAELRGGKWYVRGSIRKVSEPGAVRDATDAAWHNVKYKLVRGLSVGFNKAKLKGTRIIEWVWRELSLVTIPSNSEANILTVRSAYLAASGETSVVSSPGVSGIQPNPRRSMTIQEQITQHENSRAAKVAARDALLERSAAEGRTLDQSESESFDTLDGEIESIDAHLARLNRAKAENATRAVAVTAANTSTASQSRSGVAVVSTRPNTEPGIMFARHVMALAVCKGNKYEAAEYAKQTWGDAADEIVSALRHGITQTRAAVAPGTTAQATFAAPLVVTNYATELLELLRPATLLGRIPGLRRVPFNTSMPAQTAGGTYKWVGQGKMKPVTNAQYAAVTLSFAKASGIIVLTEELVKLSTPSAEAAVRDEMVKGISQFLDGQFVDSTVAAVANVNPASITNGVTGHRSDGHGRGRRARTSRPASRRSRRRTTGSPGS
jgi:HK97 family phage major capsid protein/HK97 family phage prohead protease